MILSTSRRVLAQIFDGKGTMFQGGSRTWRVLTVAASAMLVAPYVSVLRAEPAPANPTPPGPVSVELIRTLPGLAWPILVLLILIFYGRSVARLVTGLVWRVRAGASIRIGSLQLERLNVAVTRQGQSLSAAVKVEDDPGVFAISRREVLENSRGMFLAHQITPSRKSDQFYDVAIYLVPYDPTERSLTPYPRVSLMSVRRVGYFFGPGWQSKVFIVEDRANSVWKVYLQR
jgi:hypothetical protein